jgi:hypothetical protein
VSPEITGDAPWMPTSEPTCLLHRMAPVLASSTVKFCLCRAEVQHSVATNSRPPASAGTDRTSPFRDTLHTTAPVAALKAFMLK